MGAHVRLGDGGGPEDCEEEDDEESDEDEPDEADVLPLSLEEEDDEEDAEDGIVKLYGLAGQSRKRKAAARRKQLTET